MTDHLAEARNHVQQASEYAGEGVRKQLLSVDEGLMEFADGDKTEPTPADEDRVAELGDKLSGLMDRTDGRVRAHIDEARDHLASFRAEAA